MTKTRKSNKRNRKTRRGGKLNTNTFIGGNKRMNYNSLGLVGGCNKLNGSEYVGGSNKLKGGSNKLSDDELGNSNVDSFIGGCNKLVGSELKGGSKKRRKRVKRGGSSMGTFLGGTGPIVNTFNKLFGTNV